MSRSSEERTQALLFADLIGAAEVGDQGVAAFLHGRPEGGGRVQDPRLDPPIEGMEPVRHPGAHRAGGIVTRV